jgi:hypothetical protein
VRCACLAKMATLPSESTCGGKDIRDSSETNYLLVCVLSHARLWIISSVLLQPMTVAGWNSPPDVCATDSPANRVSLCPLFCVLTMTDHRRPRQPTATTTDAHADHRPRPRLTTTTIDSDGHGAAAAVARRSNGGAQDGGGGAWDSSGQWGTGTFLCIAFFSRDNQNNLVVACRQSIAIAHLSFQYSENCSQVIANLS